MTAAIPTGGWVASPGDSAHAVRGASGRPPQGGDRATSENVRDHLALPAALAKLALLALALAIVIWGRVDDDTTRRAETPAAAALRGAVA